MSAVPELEESEQAVWSLEEIASLKTARHAVLKAEVAAERERIYAEYEWHRSSTNANAELDLSCAQTDYKTSLRAELHELEEAHVNQLDQLQLFFRKQCTLIEMAAGQLLAIAKTQKTQKVLQLESAKSAQVASVNFTMPYPTESLPSKAPLDENRQPLS